MLDAGVNRVVESNEDNNVWEGDLPPVPSGVARLRFNLHPASPAGASVPGLSEVLRFNVASSVADGQVRSLNFNITSTDNNGTGTAGGDWNTWQSSAEFVGLTNADFQLVGLADPSTPIPGTWILYGNEFVLGGDANTARVVTQATFMPTAPLAVSAGTSRTFALRMDTTGASAPDNDTLRLDIVGVEGVGAPEGIPLYGNLIQY